MTDYRKEQASEIKSLRSIFAKNLTILSSDSFSILISSLSHHPSKLLASNEGAIISVDVEYPAYYPHKPPILQIKNVCNVSKQHIRDMTHLSMNIASNNAQSNTPTMFEIICELQQYMMQEFSHLNTPNSRQKSKRKNRNNNNHATTHMDGNTINRHKSDRKTWTKKEKRAPRQCRQSMQNRQSRQNRQLQDRESRQGHGVDNKLFTIGSVLSQLVSLTKKMNRLIDSAPGIPVTFEVFIYLKHPLVLKMNDKSVSKIGHRYMYSPKNKIKKTNLNDKYSDYLMVMDNRQFIDQCSLKCIFSDKDRKKLKFKTDCRIFSIKVDEIQEQFSKIRYTG